ncbi:MAG: polymer-forming cytoskeletal protein [Pseudomonadota bacterium]
MNPRKGMSPSVIAENMCVLGNIVSDGVLDIDGQVDGNVRAHTVTVRANARIRGDVMADDIFIYGAVEGLIKAQNVTLFASAQVSGTIMHESIIIEDGAVVDGKLKRTERLLLTDQSSETARRDVPPTIHSSFDNDNDNDEPQSEAEIRVLENLRLIS